MWHAKLKAKKLKSLLKVKIREKKKKADICRGKRRKEKTTKIVSLACLRRKPKQKIKGETKEKKAKPTLSTVKGDL